MDKKKILVVDDERELVMQLKAMLEGEGYDVKTAENGNIALDICQGDESVVITDLKMPKMSGIELLEKIKAKYPWMPVIMITGQGTIESAVKAIKNGASDYIEKPYKHEVIFNRVEKEIKMLRINEEVERLKKQKEKEFRLDDIIGSSKSIDDIKDLIRQVAPTSSSVLIEGASGTGKEMIAKGVHYLSNRRYENFVVVNCAAIPETLLESELFGYKKGSFTDARMDKKGFFEEADRGTLFLDEIGDMSVALQAKILRVLQEGEFTKIGETKSKRVDVRMVAATNKNLKEAIKRGEFREDLYFRINVISIGVPSLTERKEDIPKLVRHFIAKYDYETGKRVTGISENSMKMLMNYNWPGNIRELENIIERAVILTRGDTIESEIIEANVEPENGDVEISGYGIGYREEVRRFERGLILRAIEEAGGQYSKAAEKMGISRHSLRYQMAKLGIKGGEEQED